ncbi:MAG: efflux RND transporter periplasmic adaptor subunit [Nannocystaceae bacterium]|nr:efflux RND transporter periplasmic adaptor subunit [Nannocystaceae bacterium]
MRPWRRTWLPLALAWPWGGCGGAEPHAAAQTSAPAPADPSIVTLPEGSPMLERIVTAAVALHAMPSDEVSTPAQVEIEPSRHARVLLPAPGRISEVRVKLGDRVAAGDVVATLDSPDADAAIAALRQAEADIAAATAALEKAERDVERVRDLFEHGAVAKKEVINADAALAQARAEQSRARAVRQQASRRLQLLGLDPRRDQQTIAVRAPIAGKVLRLDVAPDEYRTDTAEALMEIADLSVLVVAADVAENVIRLIEVGEPVQIELVAFPGEVFDAKVVRIADEVDPETRTIEVHMELPNPEGRFRPAMFGRVRHGHSAVERVAVPPQSLVRKDERDLVVVELARGRYEVRAVTIEARSGDLVAIDGVAVGERVVTDGAVLLVPQ